MANYGLGLGAFTQGFAGGLGLGQKWQDTQRRNDQQKAIEGVNTEVKSAFDADVAAGKTTPDKYTDYWVQNGLPKLTQTYIQNGNVEQAAALQKWGQSDAAQRGTAAFGRLLTAGNFEDAGKAFTDLATTKGYLPPGYVLAGSEAVPGANGQQGYKFTWRAPDGKSYSQQFGSIDELKTAAAGALNPEAMAKMHLERANWAAEDQRRLGLYRGQKEIDAQPGLQPAPDGFRWNADRTGYEAIPGGPADVGYQGAKAQATQPPPADYRRTPDGSAVEPIPGGPADLDAQKRARVKIALDAGLVAGSPAFKAFVVSGKLPREDAQPLSATDKKAILEADEAVAGNQAAIDNLKKAGELSGKALSGPGAEWRASIANNVPLVGNTVAWASPEQAQATAELTNTVTTNALQQLKTIFGAAPTEGERAILLQIQGAATQPKEVREAIYRQAAQMAQRRLDFNKQRADALRGGTFYQSGSPAGAPGQSGASPSAPDGAKNLSRAPGGAPAVGQIDGGYMFKGGDPANPASWEQVQ